MAFNQGLSQEEKDRINQAMREQLAQGKSKEEVRAWGEAQAEISTASGKTNPSAGTGAPAVDGASASGAGSSESLSQFAQTAGRKRPRTDEDGEVINLAEDFGEVGAVVEGIPFIGDLIDDMYGAVKQGWAQGQTVDDALGLFASGDDADPEQIQKYIEAVNKMQDRPPSTEMQDFDKTFEEAGGGAWGFIKAIAKNPSVAVNTALSSMVAMINPGSAAGAAVGGGGGAAVGAGFAGVGAIPGAIGGAFAGAGGVLETGVSFTEFLQEEIKKKGGKFDEAGVMSVLEDEDAMFRIRGKAAARGGVIAVIDGITAGVASKAAKGISANAKRAAKLKGVLGATAIEGAGGGLGETAARLVVGQELDAKEIGLEIVGEFGTGATIGKAAVESQPVYEINGQKVNRRQVESLIKDDPASLGSVKVKNDPEIKALVDEKLSGISDINANADLITKEESEARTSAIDKIARAKRDQSRFKKNTPEYGAFSRFIEKAKGELKEVVAEQNKNYEGLNPKQKEVISGAQAASANFDAAIASIQNKYKDGETISTEDQQIIDEFTALKNETIAVADEARAEGRAFAQQKAAEAEARTQEKQAEQEAVAEEEAVEAEAEALGVDPAVLQAQREEAESIIDEEATDNQKVIDNLSDSLVESGINLVPVEGAVDSSTPDNYIPLSKNKDAYSKGDFERKIETLEPLALIDANSRKHEIQKEASARGWDTDVDYVQQGDGFILQGTIKAPKRNEPVSVGIQNQQAEQAAPVESFEDTGVELDEQGQPVRQKQIDNYIQDIKDNPGLTPDEYRDNFADDSLTAEEAEFAEDQALSPAGAVVGTKVDVKEGDDAGPVKQRTAPSITEAAQPIADKAEQYKAEDLGNNVYKFDNNKNKYAFINSLKRRGHAVTENPDGTVSVEEGGGVDYSLPENKSIEELRKSPIGLKFARRSISKLEDLMKGPEGFSYSTTSRVKDFLEKTAYFHNIELEGDNLEAQLDDLDGYLSYLQKKNKEEGPSFSVDEASAPENFTQHQDLRGVAGNRIKMNIGLENNPIDNIDGIIDKLDSDPRVRLGSTEQVTGEYEGNPERTVVVDAKFDGTASDFRKYIEQLNADLTQEAIGVQFNGRGSLIYDPKFEGDKYKFDSEFFIQPSNQTKERSGALDAADLSKLGIDEADVFNKAQEGQSYVKTPFEKKGAVVSADKSIGGKGGFASGGDAREAITTAGKSMSVADGMQLIENMFEEGPNGNTGKALRAFMGDIAGDPNANVGKNVPAFSKIQYKVGEPLTLERLQEYRDQYDRLAGYKGAHQHLDRQFAIKTENTLNLPKAKKPSRKLGPDEGQQVRPEQELAVVTPTDFRGRFGRPRSVIDRIAPDKSLEPGIVLGKDVQEKEGTEAFEPSFDRRDIGKEEVRGLRQRIGKQPKVDEAFVEKYNDNKLSDDQLIKSMAGFILGTQKNPDLQGFALEKFAEQVDAGKLRGKSVKQIFGAARTIANGAATLRNEAFGQSRDYQALRNKVRRAEQAFFAENGYEPSLDDIADYLNDNKSKYRVKEDVTAADVESAKFDEIETELSGVQGEARDKAQTRIAQEAGLDQLTTQLIGDNTASIDDVVEPLIAKRPVTPSKGKFTDQAPRRGAKFDVKGDKDAARIKKSNTEIDKDINEAIGKQIGRAEITDNWSFIKDLMGIEADNFDDLSKNEKRDLKRKLVKGLAQEAEDRLGKTQTPSIESDFNIEEGSRTYTTDTGRDRATLQVNSHREYWPNARQEIKDAIKDTDFNNDWVQWSPGTFGSQATAKGRSLDPVKTRRMQNQVIEVNKIAANRGLRVRQDTRNPGVYHIYKPGKPGSLSASYSVEPHQTKADKAWNKRIMDRLKQAWPDIKVSDSAELWNSSVSGLRMSGVNIPAGLKGMYVPGQNKVRLNPNKATKDTAIHEYGHIWSRQLMRENPQLWLKGRELLKGSKYHKAVHSIPTYREYLEGNPSKYWEEVMANAIGKHGAALFDSAKDAKKWDNWMKSVGDWIKQKLGIESAKPYEDLTLGDWLDTAVHGVFTGKVPVAEQKPSVEFSLEEGSVDAEAAKIAGKAKDPKWYKSPLKWLIPPAADDYHGLVSKIKNIAKGKIESVTRAFEKNHHAYVDASTKIRETVKNINKNLSFKLDQKDVATIDGVKVNAAQAIQAHVDGKPTPFTEQSNVQDYITKMEDLGILKPSTGKKGYSTASPQADLVSYILDDLYQEHFADFNAKKGEVFNEQALNDIRREYGNKFADALENSLQRMSTGKSGGSLSDPATRKWNDWALGSVSTIMFLNFRSAALQMLSVGNYGFSSDVNGFTYTKNLLKGLATLPVDLFNPNSDLRKRLNSPYLKERRARAGFDVNLSEFVDKLRGSNDIPSITKKILEFGFKATAFADSLAIAVGGNAFIDSDGSEAKWKEHTERAQQSSRPDRVSQWQTSGVSKYVLAFANTPQQYFRLAQKATRTIKEKGISSKEGRAALAQIVWYMGIQNAIFTSLQAASMALFNGLGTEGEEDEERNMLNSAAGTILRGMGLYGAVIDSVKSVIVEAYKQEQKPVPDHVKSVMKAASISPPLSRKINDLQAIGNAYKYDRDKTGAESTTATALARGTAVATNLPTDWLQKKMVAVGDLNDERFTSFQKLLRLMGYTEYTLLGKGKKDKFGDISFDDIDFDDVDFDEVEF